MRWLACMCAYAAGLALVMLSTQHPIVNWADYIIGCLILSGLALYAARDSR